MSWKIGFKFPAENGILSSPLSPGSPS